MSFIENILKLIIVIALLWVIVFFLSKLGHAHDMWINHGNYKSPLGTHCCGTHENHETGELEGDCWPLDRSQVEDRNSAYYIKPLKQEYPKAHALQSEDGKYWYCGMKHAASKNGFHIRCFFYPGAGV